MGEGEITNVELGDARGLKLVGKEGSRIGSPVFIPSKEIGERFEKRGYALLASPVCFRAKPLRLEQTALMHQSILLTTEKMMK